ncbi:tumor suppressor protein Gltscr2 [Phellopilus nigrolimitatus]|nr:tumor suppressor protein Gltscr2 [Phellopilus nigrolimitatus]
MAVTTMKKNTMINRTGSPAQHAQPSRKGKKAWRKNVDIGEVETNMEEMRTEERETGSKLQSKANDELFQIDVKGDDKVRKSLPKFNKLQLSYNKVLAERSAVSAVYSRPSTSSKKRPLVSHEEKSRLLRIAKRKRLGPLNSIVDHTELGQGSAILEPSHAVKESGKYNVWTAEKDAAHEEDISAEKRDFLLPLVEKPAIKPPQVPDPRATILLAAVVAPHAGASYNPPAEAHQELLRRANDKAEKQEKTHERYVSIKNRMDAARKTQAKDVQPGIPLGMAVDGDAGANDEATEGEDEGAETPVSSKASVRKTQQQRRKASKLQAEKRALAERAAKKRFLGSLSTLKALRTSVDKSLSRHGQVRLQRRLVLQEKLRQSGLAGSRLGKHIVQLGEDLSESLRGLKVEGNLFRDRFLSLQHRALLEPRVPVLPKRRRPKMKEVEKFAWKRFE